VTTQIRQLRCFVSAPAGTDLSQLLEALKENDIQVLDPARFFPGAVKITDKIIDGISCRFSHSCLRDSSFKC
jgi:hypothetical protein